MIGSSSNKAERCDREDVVRLSTIEGAEPEGCLWVFAVPSVAGNGIDRSSLGASGEKEGNEVKDLSEEAIDDAELDI